MPKKTNDKNNQQEQNKKNTGSTQRRTRPVAPTVVAPKLTPEQKKERERTEHLENLEATVNARRKTEQKFVNRYGPSGSVDIPEIMVDYTNLKIVPPKDFSPADVSMVVLGSCMREEWMDRVMTSSSFNAGSMTVQEFNREFLVSGIISGDKRTGYFPPVLMEGKHQAKQAIEDYKKGDPTRMVQMVDDVCDFAIKGLKSHTFYPVSSILAPDSNEYNVGKGLLLMTGRILEKEPFKSQSRIPVEERAKLVAYSHLAEAQSELVTRKIALMKEPPKPNTPEREEQVAEFLLHEYMSNTLSHAHDTKMDLHTELTEDLMERCAMTPGSREYQRISSQPEILGDVGVSLMNLAKVQRLTDHEAILAAPDYKEKFRSLYMDEIKKTDYYKKLVSTDGNEFKDALMEAEGKVRKGFDAFPDVKLNNEAAPFNQAMQPAFDAEIKRLTDKVNTFAEEKAIERNSVEKYNAEGTERIMDVAADAYEDFVNHLPKSQKTVKTKDGQKDVFPKVTDPTYKPVYDALESLANEAESFYNLGQKNKVKAKNLDTYATRLDSAISAVDEYFKKNTEIPAEAEAKAAHLSILRVRRALNGQKIGMSLGRKRNDRVSDVKKVLRAKTPFSSTDVQHLTDRVKSEMQMERFGADDMKKQLQDKAITATERLGELISKEGDLTPDDKKAAQGLVKDVFNYRLFTTMKNQVGKTCVIPLDKLIPGVTDHIPEFQKETADLTKDKLVQFAFGERSEELIGVGRDGYALNLHDPRIKRRDEVEKYFADEQTRQSQVVTGQIKAQIKERTDEVLRKAERKAVENYMECAEGLAKDHSIVERRFHEVYGSKPKMPDSIRLHEEYNSLVIDPPPEMDENTITAIVLGSIMQSDVLKDKTVTSSFQSGSTTFQNFNQNFLTSNIISATPDFQRQGSLSLAMVEGRRKAVEAIEEYKKGKPEKAAEMVETLINFGIDSANSALYINSEYLFRNEAGENNATKQLINLTGEMIGKPPLKVTGNANEAAKQKCKAFNLHMNTVNSVYENKYDLFSKPEKPGTPERGQKIGEMIFNEYLISTLKEAAREKNKMAGKIGDSVHDELGLDASLAAEARMDVGSAFQFENAEVEGNYSIYYRTGHEILAGTPEGVETLKKLYMPAIQKSALYTQLLTAEGDKYDQLLRDIDKETKGGFQSIKGVNIGKPEASFNDQNAAQLSLLNEEIKSRMMDAARMVTRNNFKNMKGDVEPGSFAEVLSDIETSYDLSSMNPKDVKNLTNSSTLKKFKTAFTKLKTYAQGIAEADEITDANSQTYSENARQVEQHADAILGKANLAKATPAERTLIMLCRRLKFTLEQSRAVIAEPGLKAERAANMATWKKDIDQTRDAEFRKTHGDGQYSKEDLLYAGLSRNALTNMLKTQRKILEEQKVGTKYYRKPMIDDAMTASTELTKMILKGDDHIRTHKEQVRKYMLDIMAERVLVAFDNIKVVLNEPMTYARRFAESIPEFKDALDNPTIGKVGSFVFDNAADKSLRQIPKNKMIGDLDNLYLVGMNKNLKEIERKEAEWAKKEPVKEPVKEPEMALVLVPEKEPEKAPEEEQKNINQLGEEKEPDLDDEIIEEKEPEKPKNMEELVEKMTFVEIKMSTASLYKPDVIPEPQPVPQVVEPKQAEPKQQEGNPEVQPVQPVVEPVQPVPQVVEPVQPVIQPEVQPVAQPEVQPVVQPEVQPVAQPQGMGEADPRPQPEVPPVEQPGREQLKSFSDAVHVLNHSRERFLQGLNNIKEIFLRDHPRAAGLTDEEFRQNAIQEFGQIGNQQYRDMEIKLDQCITNLSNPNTTPTEMWNSMKSFRMAAAKYAKDNDTWNPFASKIRKDRVSHSKEATVTMRVMMSALEAAAAPLTKPGFGYGGITRENSISTGMNKFYEACAAAEAKGQELYHMDVMTQQQVRDEYAVLEDLSKERVLIKDACSKRTKAKLSEELYTENKENLLDVKKGFVSTYDMAGECLVRNYLIRAAESRNPAELRAMREEIRGNTFKRREAELAQDPTFREIALRHPNSIYTRWTRVEKNVQKINNESKSHLDGFAMRGGVLGAAGYVAYGDGYHDPGAEGQKAVRNARLARVITESILKDPKYACLQRAVATKKLTKADVIIEAMNYVESKRIPIIDNENKLNPEFRRKLENGDLARGMVNSQKQILERARTRDPQARANATRRFKLNEAQNKRQNPVLGA